MMLQSMLFVSMIFAFCFGSATGPFEASSYEWKSITPAAEFPQSYNYPVFVVGEWMVALNNGAWLSNDGCNWNRTSLQDSGLNSAYLKYVQFNGAIYALGSMTGNYESFTISTKIVRTRDFMNWETVAESSNLPKRIFYGAAVFNNKIWMIGGYDGKSYQNDVWNSADGVIWKKVANAPWSPRNAGVVTVFQDKIWMLGGSVIDGQTENNRNSTKEIWTTLDGVTWKQERPSFDKKWGGTPIVFDNKLWLVGMNRGNGFASAVWVTDDGINWSEQMAPWSPRGAVAAWVFDGRLFITGGKSSHTENGEIKFVYSNDVWAMTRKSE